MHLPISIPNNALLFFGFPNTHKGKQAIQVFEEKVALLPKPLQAFCKEPSFEKSYLWHFEKTYLFAIPNIQTLEAYQDIINSFGVLNEFATHEEVVISLKSTEDIVEFYTMIQEYNENQSTCVSEKKDVL